MEVWTIANDIHIPKHNVKALNCWYENIKEIKPKGIILNGDIFDCGFCSRHDIFTPPKCHWSDDDFYEASVKDYEEGIKFFDTLQRLARGATKIFNLGNHEVWLTDFIAKAPKSRSALFGLDERFQLKKKGWKINPYKKIFKLGKLRVVHTLFDSNSRGGGRHHAAKHIDTMGASVIYGHFHDIQISSKVTPEAISHMAWCNGCLCELNPAYLRNGPQNWSHGFANVYLRKSGNFQVDLLRIIEGKVVVHGKELGC
jgi:hypothetical protein